jgi:hypothetical protein
MHGNDRKEEKNEQHTPTVVFLDNEQIDFLNTLKKRYFLSCGCNLSRNRILTELVNCLMRMNPDLSELDPDKEDLCQFILRKVKDA